MILLNYLHGEVKEENPHLAPNLANRIKGYRTLGQVLQQQHHLREHIDAGKFRVSVHVGGSPGTHVPVFRRHVPQRLPPVGDRHVNRSEVHGVHVIVTHPQREEHGDIHSDARPGVHLHPLQLQPHDLEVRIGRPESVHGGEEENEAHRAGDLKTVGINDMG